tara:strand:+ start:2513 stop:2917 length:405 start_codon:yes stop_codon:yes gene_type:complete
MDIVKNTETIITNFTNLIDINKEYTNKELVNILNTIYNGVYKTRKEPTKYNLFVKENMSKLKMTYPDLSRQDLMRKTGELWRETKNKSENEENTFDKDDNNTSDIQEKNFKKDANNTSEIEDDVPVKKTVKKKK